MDEIRFSRPTITPEPVRGEKRKTSNSLFKKIFRVLGVVIILGAVILVILWGKDALEGIFKTKSEFYSAVFLTNGQVYFGKMTENNKLEIVLNNVYYIQISEKATPENPANTLNQTSFNLIKLGNELHGPTDELFINRSQVVFYEKLRDDSKVVESIKNYKQ